MAKTSVMCETSILLLIWKEEKKMAWQNNPLISVS
jgi:hypothetical protein